MFQQRDQLVPLDQNAGRIVNQQLAQRLIATIIRAIANWYRLRGRFFYVKVDIDLLLASLLQPFLLGGNRDFVAKLEHAQPGLICLLRDFVLLGSFSLEPMDGPQRLIHRRRLERPRPTDEAAPDVRSLGPEVFACGLIPTRRPITEPSAVTAATAT